jgi:hypothetical protein
MVKVEDCAAALRLKVGRREPFDGAQGRPFDGAQGKDWMGGRLERLNVGTLEGLKVSFDFAQDRSFEREH